MSELDNIERAFLEFDVKTKHLISSLFKEEKENGKVIKKVHQKRADSDTFNAMRK